MSGWIGEAVRAGARVERACAAVGLSARTLQRWRQAGAIQGDARCREHRAPGAVRTPANRLTNAERRAILTVANPAEFAHRSPHQIVPALADQGHYLASESTFYRVLRAADQLARRGRPKAAPRARPAPLTATGPHQVWSWDITDLATTVKGMFFYLYLIMDVFSRKIVGWEVYPSESAEQAASVFRKAHRREGVRADALVLHSDNGAPMKGATRLATLQRLGVVPSFSRPSVSDDNPQLVSRCSIPSRAIQGSPNRPSRAAMTPAPGSMDSIAGTTPSTATAPCASSPPRSAIAARILTCSPGVTPSIGWPRPSIPNAGAARRATGSPRPRSSSTLENRPRRSIKTN